MDKANNLMTVDELCEVLHCGKNLAYKLCKQPSFPAVRVGNHKLFIDRIGLEQWIKEQYER